MLQQGRVKLQPLGGGGGVGGDYPLFFGGVAWWNTEVDRKYSTAETGQALLCHSILQLHEIMAEHIQSCPSPLRLGIHCQTVISDARLKMLNSSTSFCIDELNE